MNSHYTIAIIDYRMGNIFSLENLLRKLGYKTKITSDRSKILSADGAILPGVGGFPVAMDHIRELGLSETINDFVITGKPLMGICLGFQILFDKSEEMGFTPGLGILPGQVESIHKCNQSLRVPHVGWNSVEITAGFQEIDTEGVRLPIINKEYFYFVHSYMVNPYNKEVIYTKTRYSDLEFCSSILKDNIYACQFHPEKSGKKGIAMFEKFFQ